jgi:hypothetical protein
MKENHDICAVILHFSSALNAKALRFVLLCCLMLAAEAKSQVVYDVEPAVESMEKARKERTKSSDKKISGYRIFVGFSSKRAEATEIQKKADEIFGSTYGALLIYDEPNFKVYIGAFTTAAEADAALADIKKEFPTARKLRLQIPNPGYSGPEGN